MPIYVSDAEVILCYQNVIFHRILTESTMLNLLQVMRGGVTGQDHKSRPSVTEYHCNRRF